MMMSRQSQKVSILTKKIADNQEILNTLRKSNTAIEEHKSASGLVKLTYYPKDKTAYEITVSSDWFHSPGLRSDFHHCMKIARDGFMELLEKDLQLMKEALGKLQ